MNAPVSDDRLGPWSVSEVRSLALDELGQRYRRYRLPVAHAERAMAQSLQRYGQICPIVVCLREDRPEVLDGFTRLAAARTLKRMPTLSARLIEADERSAKAAMYVLNRWGRRPHELEEAWLVHALVREDGLSQVEAGQLLGRHKSWVCRRLALLEKLGEPVKQQLRVGLVSLSVARELTRLPVGNQEAVLAAARRESLSSVEVRGVVDLLAGCAHGRQMTFVLDKPREALRQAQQETRSSWDPRLSRAGNRISNRLGYLLEALGRMEQWLRYRGWSDLSAADRRVLQPALSRLSRDSRVVGELADDVLNEPEVT
jgi:ParB-like chromosome segregation protein Spo0J